MSPIDAWITSMPISIANSAADWIWAPMWKKYPKLRMALSEGGIGWIPYLLERADFTHRHHKAWTNADFGGKKPSEVFKSTSSPASSRTISACRTSSTSARTWSAGNATTPTPTAPGRTRPRSSGNSRKHLSDETINKVTHLNVMREYNYDPFALLGRENCTVGALRAQAKAKGEHRASPRHGRCRTEARGRQAGHVGRH
jgi:hypothetical protein